MLGDVNVEFVDIYVFKGLKQLFLETIVHALGGRSNNMALYGDTSSFTIKFANTDCCSSKVRTRDILHLLTSLCKYLSLFLISLDTSK